MTYDLYAELAAQQACSVNVRLPDGLSSGFVDGCTVWFAVSEISRAEYEVRLEGEQDKNKKKELKQIKQKHEQAKTDARNCYMNKAQAEALRLPAELDLDPWPPDPLHAGWLALVVDFEILTPWYSKDDRMFHVLDNPMRKDRVFGVPFMAAASWKGLLRWACRMHAGLRQHLEQGKRFEEWPEPNWIRHLFGNEKGMRGDFHQGALVFYPTWFDKIGFEVINPHSRERRAGTQPVYYEVVPGRRPKPNNSNEYEKGGKGTLRLLYAPWPGMKGSTAPAKWLPNLLQAIEELLTCYGISAKRTVGWGTAEIEKWRAWKNETPADQPIEADNRGKLLEQLLRESGGGV